MAAGLPYARGGGGCAAKGGGEASQALVVLSGDGGCFIQAVAGQGRPQAWREAVGPDTVVRSGPARGRFRTGCGRVLLRARVGTNRARNGNGAARAVHPGLGRRTYDSWCTGREVRVIGRAESFGLIGIMRARPKYTEYTRVRRVRGCCGGAGWARRIYSARACVPPYQNGRRIDSCAPV